MTLGITVGKFYPFHLGHDLLIRTAKARVDRLVVLMAYKPSQEVPGTVRAHWIRSMHPDVEVIEVLDDLPNESRPWAERALVVLGGRKPDIAFTSEDYGEEWADMMGARHVAVDPGRERYSVSGTRVRADLAKHWEMLTPPAKAYFARRVCVTGVESSGTSTLAQSLAERYRTVWVPEYGRCYWEGRRHTPGQAKWDSYEFERIARGQAIWEDDLAMGANRVVICDTDPLTTHVWHRRYVGTYSEAVEKIADSRRYDLYLLTEPDFGFVQDGTREGKGIRMEMHRWFVEVLTQKGRGFMTIGGNHEERVSRAAQAIDPLLVFPPLADP
jgi:NadR type nicotinamide-nucleotide adenylyltransferase